MRKSLEMRKSDINTIKAVVAVVTAPAILFIYFESDLSFSCTIYYMQITATYYIKGKQLLLLLPQSWQQQAQWENVAGGVIKLETMRPH